MGCDAVTHDCQSVEAEDERAECEHEHEYEHEYEYEPDVKTIEMTGTAVKPCISLHARLA
jgi:hypothetical protein